MATCVSKFRKRTETPAPIKKALPMRGAFSHLAKDGVSFEQITQALIAALAEKYPSEEDDYRSCIYPRDVFPDSVVYQYDGVLYRAAYTFDGTVATLTSEPEAVQVSYVAAGGDPASPAPPGSDEALDVAEATTPTKSLAKQVTDTLAKLAARATPALGAK